MLNIFGKSKDKKRNRKPYDTVRSGAAHAAIWRNYDKEREPYFKVSLSRAVGSREHEHVYRDLFLDDLADVPEMLRQLAERLSQEPLLTPVMRRRMRQLAESWEFVVELLKTNGVAQQGMEESPRRKDQ